MRQRAILPTVCVLTYALSIVICVTVARGDEPPVRVEHLGYGRGDPHGQLHQFQITIVNKHDRPAWFLFPHFAPKPPPKNGVFKNYNNQGQRLLTACSGKDLEHVVIVPTAGAAFHGHAVFLGMLLQQGQREAIQPSEVLAKTLVTDA